MLAEFVGQTPLQWLQEVFEICRDFHRSGRPAVEKLQCRQIVLALAFTHRLRIRVSGADNPLLRLRPPVGMKCLDQSVEQRVVPCSQTNPQMSSGLNNSTLL